MSDPATPGVRTFRFLGHDLTPLPLSQVLHRAAWFLALALLASAAGLPLTPEGVAGGFLICCLMGAGVSFATLRGACVLILVAIAMTPLFSAIALALSGS